MAKQLNLSVNELWALLTRTFEALYGHERDYYDMARTVLWLECHGHDGIEQLIDALPILENTNLPDPSFTEKSSNHIVLNGGGHSLLCIGRSVADLAMAYASENEIARLDITDVGNSQALIGVLSYIESQHFSAVILCEDMQALITSGEKYPIIYKGVELGVTSVMCSRDLNFLMPQLEMGSKVLKNKESQKETYTLSLEDGINIQYSDYDRLTAIANRVLVEATEASRRGAGE